MESFHWCHLSNHEGHPKVKIKHHRYLQSSIPLNNPFFAHSPMRPIFIPERARALRADWAPGPGVLVLEESQNQQPLK